MGFKEQADIINDNFAYLVQAKQNKIPDLSDIRDGAGKGATAIQPEDNISELTNDSNYQSGDQVTASIGTHNTSTTAHSDIRTAINTEKTRATGVEGGLQTSINTINGKIPSQASTTNQLADKSFVNSSIATETANFVGTFNTLAELQAVPNPTNNDYGFVKTTDTTGNTIYNRYKYVASVPEWKFEYSLNNSSFTATQWAAINSGATSELVGKITTNETAISDHVGNTSNPHSVTKAQVGLGNVDNTSDANKPVSTAQQTALDLKQDKSTAVTHTASTAVGSATKPVYVKADGTTAEITSYEGTSAKATADASGNVITTTYATKTEMGNKQDKLSEGSAISLANNEVAVSLYDPSKFTVVGSPTITDDGVASGFNDKNHLKATTITMRNKLVIKGNFTLNSLVQTNNIYPLRFHDATNNIWGAVYVRSYLQNYIGSVWTTSISSSLYNVNTPIFYEFTIENSSFSCIYRQNNNVIGTLSGSNITGFTSNSNIDVYIGRDTNDNLSFISDLSQFSITVDGKEVFNGSKTIYQALDEKQNVLTAGSNIQISDTNVISATDTTYTAGTGIKIENNVISNTQTSAEWGKITGTLSSQTDLQTALNGKQATISDLETIRSGAAAGATAVQPGANVSTLTNDAGYIDKTVGDLTKYTTTTNLMIELGKKQNIISDLADIRDGAAAGSTALQPNDNISELTNDAGYQTASDVSTAISGKQDKLTAGTNITIENNVISATGQAATTWGSITGTLTNQTDLKNALDGKYDASNPNGYTSNVGTITGIKMNGASKGTSGEVDLGTVITSTADCVKTSGNQTVAGVKTFTGNPVFNGDAVGSQLTVNRTNNTSGYSVIKYANGGTIKGYLGISHEGKPLYGNASGTYYNVVRNSTLNTAVGSATKPVYINADGVATAITSYEGNAATATKATQDASGNVITSTYETKANVTSAISTHNTSVDAHEDIREKIRDIELFKFPNAIIIGSPHINNGQVSNFSATNYMQFPFIVDVRSKNFQIDFSFTTGSNVTTQQNIIDSKFGLALAIANGKGLMAISTTGTNWDLGSVVGTINIAANTTYYAKLSWDGTTYKTALSTDGITYTDDMTVASTVGPYPRTMYIGGGNATELGRTANPFGGIINMNKAYLTIAGIVIWQGMDDAGLATRADVSLSNLDAAGQAKFTAKQDKLTAGTGIKIENNVISNTQTSAEWGKITGTLNSQTDLKNALDAKQDNLTAGSGITITNNTVSNDLVTDTDDVFITLHDVDPSSPEYDPNNLYPGKEDVANKVTVVDSTSSDVTYPTSKAVYTELNKKADSSTVTTLTTELSKKADSSTVTTLSNTVNTKANDSAVVHLTGNETITGTKTFSSAIAGSITGNAATATTATKATQDSAGQQINTTYIKALSVSGTTITYTKGNGTTGTITTQDTNTDTKVQSVVSTANTNYPILLNNGTAATTNTTLIDTGIYANPSTNTLGADKVDLANKVTMQYNSTTEALEFVFA